MLELSTISFLIQVRVTAVMDAVDVEEMKMASFIDTMGLTRTVLALRGRRSA